MMFKLPLYAKLAGAGAAGLLLVGGAAASASPTLTTVLTASSQPSPSAPGKPATSAARRFALRARRLVIRSEASVLKITVRQLRQDVRGGTDVQQLAAKAGMDKAQFTAALLADLKPKLDALVKAGKLKQGRENAILNRVRKGWIPLWTLPTAPRTSSPSAAQSQTS